MKLNDHNEPGTFAQLAHARGPLALCRKVVARIEKVKAAILSEFRDGLEDYQHLLHLAVNEAEAIAWQTDYPHLFFPALATEKLQAVANWRARQQFVQRTHARPALAA